MSTHFFAESDRTQSHEITTDDAAFMLELMNSEGWLQYIGDRQINSVDDASTYIENGLVASRVEHGFSYYVVSDLAGNKMGVAGFLQRPYLQNPDFGFAFLPQYQGKGFALEASQAILHQAQQQFGFMVLDAVTLPTNLASQGLLQKLKFANLGVQQIEDEPLLLYRWENHK